MGECALLVAGCTHVHCSPSRPPGLHPPTHPTHPTHMPVVQLLERVYAQRESMIGISEKSGSTLDTASVTYDSKKWVRIVNTGELDSCTCRCRCRGIIEAANCVADAGSPFAGSVKLMWRSCPPHSACAPPAPHLLQGVRTIRFSSPTKVSVRSSSCSCGTTMGRRWSLISRPPVWAPAKLAIQYVTL